MIEEEKQEITTEEKIPAQDENRSPKKKKRVVGLVFTAIGLAVVAFLFAVTVTLAVDKFVKKSPVPSFCGISALIVTTGSMSGTIEEGDMIIIKKKDDYKIGDIITFMPDGASISTTHRIVRIQGDYYYTKGDANNAEDTRPIEKSNIIGKVTGRVKHVGLFFKLIKEDFGWAYMVAIVAVTAAGIILFRAASPAKKEK